MGRRWSTLRLLVREMVSHPERGSAAVLPRGAQSHGDAEMWLSLYDEEPRTKALTANGGDPNAAMQWLVSKMGVEPLP